jgi:polysaccharide pyruvyl transferase WcaK-like protein
MKIMRKRATRFCLFGASPGTGNQGVNALCWSTLEGFAHRADANFHVFHYGKTSLGGVVPGSTPPVHYQCAQMTAGRRVWREDHLWRALNAARTLPRSNAVVRLILKADAVLDASGGDSFTDLYGTSRFKNIVAPKRLALSLGRPLILLPQTYGPFKSLRNERMARNLVSEATLAYARDKDSFEKMRTLLGSHFDPRRHRQGVDLAFGLHAREPRELQSGVRQALSDRGERPLIVLNVSGLLSNEAEAAKQRFSLAVHYPALIANLVAALLQTTDAHILLLPHVQAPAGHYESDLDACRAVFNALPDRYHAAARHRITTVSQSYDATELKWLIGHADWMCGTRMHSTIAALSMGVPACALAYSLKTRGVFETCGVGESVADLRHLSAGQVLEQVLWTWQKRDSLARKISGKLPEVVTRSREQLDEMVGALQLSRAA